MLEFYFYVFLAATAALEVQMSVCLCVRHTFYSCTTFWRTSAGLLKDFCRTSEGPLQELRISKGLPKDFQRTLDFIVYKIFTSRSPHVFETCLLVACQMHLWGQSNFWFHQVLSIYLVVAVFWCWKSNYSTHCNDISQPFFQQHKKNVLLDNSVLFPQPL